MSGPEIIVNGLRRKFGQFDVEHSIVAIIELLTFHGNQVESIDEAIARFEILKSKAENRAANFDMPVAVVYQLWRTTSDRRRPAERHDDRDKAARAHH